MITPGRNIAIKVPIHQWEDTVAFYRDRAGLKVTLELEASTAFEFGGITLWIDRVPHQSQSDVWIELFTDDPDAALRLPLLPPAQKQGQRNRAKGRRLPVLCHA